MPARPRKLRDLIALGGDAIEGPWDGEEAITLMADLDAGATGAMTGGGYPDGIRQIIDPYFAGDREEAAAAYQRWLPLINYENRQCGLIAAKVLMKEGGVIRSETTRHPVLPLHPANPRRPDRDRPAYRSAGPALGQVARGKTGSTNPLRSGRQDAAMQDVLILNQKLAHTFSYYDLATGKELHRITFPDFPHEFTVDRENRYAYIGHYGIETHMHLADGGTEIFVVDIAAAKHVRTLNCWPFRRVHGMAMDEADRLYALSEGNSTLLIFDDRGNRTCPTAPCPPAATRATSSPSARTARIASAPTS